MTFGGRIRSATVADVPAIREVLLVTWRDTYSAFVPLEVIEPTTAVWHAPDVLTAELAREITFTAVSEDKSGIVGMVTAHLRREVVKVARLYVRPGGGGAEPEGSSVLRQGGVRRGR